MKCCGVTGYVTFAAGLHLLQFAAVQVLQFCVVSFVYLLEFILSTWHLLTASGEAGPYAALPQESA